MKFTKMHGSGNDYVYIDCFKEDIRNPEKLVQQISDRHKGIGSDGLVLIMPSDKCDFRMRMFNPDGSEAQMCGNASRCVGKYVFDSGLTDKTDITLETKAGIKKLQLFTTNGEVTKVTVDMGEPILKASDIPVNTSIIPNFTKDMIINQKIEFPSGSYFINCVSMGNPHTIIFTDTLVNIPLEIIGKEIEHHILFPEKTNVEFVKVESSEHAQMRVWERGTGETQACGTGACAVLVAGVLNGLLERQATIQLPGGNLKIEWNEDDNHVYMTGDAVTVFNGEFKNDY